MAKTSASLTLFAALFVATAAQAAQFEFTALIRAGATGGGDWEVGVGDTATTQADTDSLTTHWANSTPRAFQMDYSGTTNTLNVRVYNGATASGAFAQASYQPTVNGTVPSPDLIWTLPASSFFAVATAGPILGSSITVSNLTLSGISGAINVLQPVQVTTLSASRAALGSTSTVTQSEDISFFADSTGSWRLSATIQLTGLSPSAFAGADGSELAFQFSASADPVPEPGTWSLLGAGLLAMIGVSRYRKQPVKASV